MSADTKPVRENRGSGRTKPRFSMSGFYEFPFGKGKPFLSNANWLVNAIVGGWQLEGTYVYQSGFPIRFGSDAFYLGGKIAIPKGDQTVGALVQYPGFYFRCRRKSNLQGQEPGATVTNSGCATPVDHFGHYRFISRTCEVIQSTTLTRPAQRHIASEKA
jgi:hypothetical protein